MMAELEFSPEIRKTLDSYAVPSLPTGFADRLLARIEAGDTSTDASANGSANRLRTRKTGSAWWRSSRIVGSVAFLSLATATAAAAGVFGNPVYVPGVSEVLAKAELVPTPRYADPAKPQALAAKATEAAIEPTPNVPANGTEAVVSRITQLRESPRFENLTSREKLAVTRNEVRTMVRSGEATPQEARSAVRQLVQSADPEITTRLRETAQARREAMSERRERYRDATPEERAAMLQALREGRQIRQQQLNSDTDFISQP